MSHAIQLIEVDLADWPPDLEGLERGTRVQALIRWDETPLATLHFDGVDETVTPALVWQRANEAAPDEIAEAIVRDLLKAPAPPIQGAGYPSATVVVCTRDRPDDLRRCLESIRATSVLPLDVLVVDNAPATAPAESTASSFSAQYALEPRPGLNRARQSGAEAADADVLIYIDDDVVVAPGWDVALLSAFVDPEVAGATGLVLPAVLEKPAQLVFEELGGFSRGFYRREHSLEFGTPVGAGLAGAGACMAFRRHLVTELGLFDAELDAGTATHSGGDTYAFYRLLSLGHLLVYEPRARVRHRHRATMEELRRTLYGYSVGTYCYFLRCLLHRGETFALAAGARWFLEHHVRQLLRGLTRRPGAQPLGLTMAEIHGALAAPVAYVRAALRERRA